MYCAVLSRAGPWILLSKTVGGNTLPVINSVCSETFLFTLYLIKNRCYIKQFCFGDLFFLVNTLHPNSILSAHISMWKYSFQDNDIFAHSNICLFSSSSSRTVISLSNDWNRWLCVFRNKMKRKDRKALEGITVSGTNVKTELSYSS